MILFLLTFFMVYGGLHLYVFSKIKGAFPLPPVANICLMLLLVFYRVFCQAGFLGLHV